MDGADGERPLPRRRGCAASNLSIRRFSLPRRKSLADAIDCTYVCTPPVRGGGGGGGGWAREVDADSTEGVGGGGKEARNDRRRIVVVVVVVNAALQLFIDMRGLVCSAAAITPRRHEPRPARPCARRLSSRSLPDF